MQITINQQFQDHAHLILANLNREEIEQHTLEWRDCKGSEVFEKIRNTSPIVTLTNAENHAFGATAIDVVPLEIRGYFIPLFIGVKHLFCRSASYDIGSWDLIYTLQFRMMRPRKSLVYDII